MSDQVTNAQLLSVAKAAALAAGEQIRLMFNEPRRVTSKGPRDVVTDADLAAQAIITDMIRESFPEHGFLAEEENDELPTDGPILWIIDPIDGTVNYSRGLPLYCVSIAAARNNPPLGIDDVLVGVVYDPMLNELFTASVGGPCLLEGAGLHGRLLHTSDVDDLKDALIGIDWPLVAGPRQEALDLIDNLGHKVNVFRSLGSATLGMAWVAAGRLDAYANYQLKPWDVSAAGLLVKQAGGKVTDMAGEPLIMDPDGMACVTSNAHLAHHLTTRTECLPNSSFSLDN